LYILIYKIFPKYIYSSADKYITMKAEAYLEIEGIEKKGELGPYGIHDDPLGPPRRLIKRPFIAS
jgi:hypothetical protein